MQKGKIYRVSGPVVVVEGLQARMYDVVKVGEEKLVGEVIKIERDKITVQVYEATDGLKPGEPAENTARPLTVELGPGLLRSIYDGIQRPLPMLKEMMGDFIKRGAYSSALDRRKKWHFVPLVKKGAKVSQGQAIGEVKESETIQHRIMAPPGVSGTVREIREGDFTVDDFVAALDSGAKIQMAQVWPVRVSRPYSEKLVPEAPLITGQRIIDGLFPIAKGGTAAIPGPFGAGKTVMGHSLAKWSDVDVFIYVGCGERGNEMTDVLTEFPRIRDPKTGKPLMERTVLIANTSNMPVAAREASIYTGITIAEYYRDMGYDVALMADSTSRWAEAMREISSRLEEMPGEEGYPAYLPSRVAEFYERAGRVVPLSGNGMGSISLIGAVSPPGGDFSEPVTQSTLRVAKAFWALDARLANRRHFPSINWLTSYSQYETQLSEWYRKNVSDGWQELVTWAKRILTEEEKLQEIVQLVGSDALPEKEQLTLEIARLIREFFLQQNAFHEVDAFCSLEKSHMILQTILHFSEKANEALKSGARVKSILETKSRNKIADAKFGKDYKKILEEVKKGISREMAETGRAS